MSLEGHSDEEIRAVADLALQMSRNPKTRYGFLALTKQINPDAAIPEIDIANAMAERFKPSMDKLQELEKAEEERKLREKREAQRREALQVNGISESDIDDIEKLMLEKQIPSHKTAAEFMAAQRKMAEPTPAALASPKPFQLPQIDAKEFGGNLKQYARSQAYAAINELRGRRTA